MPHLANLQTLPVVRSDPRETAKAIVKNVMQTGNPTIGYHGNISMLAKPGQTVEDLMSKYNEEVEYRNRWCSWNADRRSGTERRQTEGYHSPERRTVENRRTQSHEQLQVA